MRLARLPFLRPSPLSVMKPSLPLISKSSSPSILEPFIAKPTRGKLRARLEVLVKKKRSIKRKTQASPEFREDTMRATYPFLFKDEGTWFSHLVLK